MQKSRDPIILTGLFLAMLCAVASFAGCAANNNPIAVIGDANAKPLDRIAAAESLYNAGMTGVLIARQDKLISDADFHKIRLASDAFRAAITALRTSVLNGGTLDSGLWAAVNAALNTIIDAKTKAGTL